jgi:hypothetical protein
MERARILSTIRLGTALLMMLASLFVVGLWISSHYQDDMVVVGDHSSITLVSSEGKLIVYYRNLGSPVDFSKWFYDSQWVLLSIKPTLGFLFKSLSVPPNLFGWVLSVPDWFGIFAFGGAGLALLFEWHRRFTVRLLLVVTTICAVVLGLMVYR